MALSITYNYVALLAILEFLLLGNTTTNIKVLLCQDF